MNLAAPGLLDPGLSEERVGDPDLEVTVRHAQRQDDHEPVIESSGKLKEEDDDGECAIPDSDTHRAENEKSVAVQGRTINFADDERSPAMHAADNSPERGAQTKALYIPPPWKRDRGTYNEPLPSIISLLITDESTGTPIVEVDDDLSERGRYFTVLINFP